MEEANLLQGMLTAQELLYREVKLRSYFEENPIKKYKKLYEEKKLKGIPALYSLIIIAVLWWLMLFPAILPIYFVFGDDIGDLVPVLLPIVQVIRIVLAILVYYFGFEFYKKHYGKIYKKYNEEELPVLNQEIENYNAEAKAYNEAIEGRFNQIATENNRLWNEEVSSWYPPDYMTLDAVDFFVNAARNHRAKDVAGLVNLYEQTLHMRKMEKGQEANNMMQAITMGASLFTAFAAGQTAQNTARMADSAASAARNSASTARSVEEMERRMR